METAENVEIEEGGIKTVGEALRYVRQLRKFLADKGMPSNGLDGIEDGILAKTDAICRQTQLTDFFPNMVDQIKNTWKDLMTKRLHNVISEYVLICGT